MSKKDILIIENLAAFEKLVNRDKRTYDIDMMLMPGTLEDKHKDVDPEKGIPALRRQFNLIYLLMSGVHDVHLGAGYQWLKPNDLVIVPESFLYASSNVRNCTGYCLHFKTEFMQPLLKGQFKEEFAFFDLEAPHIINITNEESTLLQETFKNIIAEYERFSPEKEDLLRNYIYILLLRIRDMYRPHAKKLHESAPRSLKITNQFRHLVEKNFLSIRSVNEYAKMMHITPKYLAEVIKENTGKPPREIINDMLLLEAKVLLRSTDKTVTEIAQVLSFDDQSHFSHFIKKQTGFTPLQLRKKL
ncbi:MAG: helix-turn-helix domain-containing protein [Chitinophagales bacterium]